MQFLKWLPPPKNKLANPHRSQIKMHNFTAECNLLKFLPFVTNAQMVILLNK